MKLSSDTYNKQTSSTNFAYLDKKLSANSLKKIDTQNFINNNSNHTMKKSFNYDAEIVAAHKLNENNLKTIESYLKGQNEEVSKKLARKLFLINIFLNSNVKKLIAENDNLKKVVNNVGTPRNKPTPNNLGHFLLKKRRKRKLKSEVERNFRCAVPNCNRAYGSENSLNQHIKLKHPKFWLHMKQNRVNYNDEEEDDEEY